jgi:hypothetical protein
VVTRLSGLARHTNGRTVREDGDRNRAAVDQESSCWQLSVVRSTSGVTRPKVCSHNAVERWRREEKEGWLCRVRSVNGGHRASEVFGS